MLFVVVSFLLVTLIAGYHLRFAGRQHELNEVSWDELIARLHPVDINGLREIAENYLHPGIQQLRIEPGTMWETVGGLPGIQKLHGNVQVMLQLAIYAERWNDGTGRVLSELMRRDAARILSSIQQIELAMITRQGLVYLGIELQEAIASYCLLRARLLGMYGECHAGLLPKLSAAI